MELTRIQDPTRNRYRSASVGSVWDLETVRKASALVIGAGALGNEVTKNLAMMGVRLIVVVDRDTVEVANLTRSVFFREADHSRLKAEVLAERLVEVNPDVTVLSLNGDVDAVLGLGLVRRMEMVFSCLDNRLARRVVNRMCQKLGKPWVDGSMENLLGDVTAYLPDGGPCYECTLTRIDQEIIAQAVSCKGIALQNLASGKVPTFSTMGSIIAALQVQEGLKFLHGHARQSLGGKKLVINSEYNDFYVTRADRDEECAGHFRYGTITEVPEWTSRETSARELLERFERDSGCRGYLRLGREIVKELFCATCDTSQELFQLRNCITIESFLCPTCGKAREMQTTSVVKGNEPFSDWPLARLGVPRLEILEVFGESHHAWYELTGDLVQFPAIAEAKAN